MVDTLRKLKSSDLPNFLDDLLTEEEILDLAQRLKIAKLILDGKSYDEISESVGTSTATVSKIGQVIKYGSRFTVLTKGSTSSCSTSKRYNVM